MPLRRILPLLAAAGALLCSVGDFGGAIPGLRPGAGSAAIDAGDDCAREDYRGIARPQGTGCDIGATEVRQHVLNVVVQAPVQWCRKRS